MPEVPTTMPPIQVFLSFSRKDEGFVQALRNHLSNLERQGELQVWTQSALPPGSTWEPALLARLQAADLVLLLVSADFNASKFIQEKELAITLERHRRGEVDVLPIFVRAADLEGHWLGDLVALPTDRKPVASWTRADDAWLDVVTGIRKMLPGLRERRKERSGRFQPIDPPPELRTELEEWRAIVERIIRLESAGIAPGELEPLRQRAATLKRQVREGRPLIPGDILDERFTLLELIGEGGFARVWKAVDERGSHVVALKVLKGDFAYDRTHRDRFEQGIRAMSRLDHPGIVRLVGAYRQEAGYLTSTGSSAGRYHYCAMEYLPGGDLQKYVKRHGPPAEWVLRRICAVAEALEHAHGRGCVHRDVKPGNILLTAELDPRLTDFDLVRMGESSHGTRTGSLGTILYAAPEMHQSGAPIDGRADVYGLAMTAVFGLYGSELPYGKIVGNRTRFLEDLALPVPIRRVLEKALEMEPADRFGSMQAFREALEAAGVADGTASRAEVGAPGLSVDAAHVVDAPGDERGASDETEASGIGILERVEATPPSTTELVSIEMDVVTPPEGTTAGDPEAAESTPDNPTGSPRPEIFEVIPPSPAVSTPPGSIVAALPAPSAPRQREIPSSREHANLPISSKVRQVLSNPSRWRLLAGTTLSFLSLGMVVWFSGIGRLSTPDPSPSSPAPAPVLQEDAVAPLGTTPSVTPVSTSKEQPGLEKQASSVSPSPKPAPQTPEPSTVQTVRLVLDCRGIEAVQVLMNGKDVGDCDQPIELMPNRRNRLEVKAQGYESFVKVFETNAKIPTTLKPVLRRVATTSGLKWISIPGGTLQMGSNDGESNEKPVHPVTVSGFQMTKSEVTVAQYRACVKAKACTEPSTKNNNGDCNWDYPDRSDHPVNCVEWSQGKAFAAWVGGRLPTEAEREYAARGTDGRKYPWGDQSPTCDHAVFDPVSYTHLTLPTNREV